MIVYHDGNWVPLEEASVPVMDHGFFYGVGLFETFRTYNGSPFLFRDHLKRLKEGLSSVFIEWEAEEAHLLEIISKGLNKNNLTDGVMRLNVSAGISDWGLPTETYEEPSTLLFTRPLPYKYTEEKEAVFLQIPRNTPEGNVRLKSHHYLNNLLGKRELRNNPNVEGIFLTKDNVVAEGLVSNIFWIKGGTIFTPAISTGILNGITRQYVIHLAKLIGVPVEEGFFSKGHLLESDEIFITNSTQEMVRITRLDTIQFSAPANSIIDILKRIYKEGTKKQLQSYQQIKRVEHQHDEYKLISK